MRLSVSEGRVSGGDSPFFIIKVVMISVSYSRQKCGATLLNRLFTAFPAVAEGFKTRLFD